MREEVVHVHLQMETMRTEVETNARTKKENDINSRKLSAIEESVKQVMEFCVKVKPHHFEPCNIMYRKWRRRFAKH
jgi:hypothetical protein